LVIDFGTFWFWRIFILVCGLSLCSPSSLKTRFARAFGSAACCFWHREKEIHPDLDMNARPSDLPGFMFISYPVYGLCLTARLPGVFEAKLVFPYVLSLQPLHKGCEERPEDLDLSRCILMETGVSGWLADWFWPWAYDEYEHSSCSNDLT